MVLYPGTNITPKTFQKSFKTNWKASLHRWNVRFLLKNISLPYFKSLCVLTKIWSWFHVKRPEMKLVGSIAARAKYFIQKTRIGILLWKDLVSTERVNNLTPKYYRVDHMFPPDVNYQIPQNVCTLVCFFLFLKTHAHHFKQELIFTL